MNDLFLLVFNAILVVIGLACLSLAVRVGSQGTWQDGLVTYAVTFPPSLSAEQVALFLSGCRGLVAPWWLRPFVIRGLGLEVVATGDGIAHYLHVPEAQAPVVLSALRAAIPAARTARLNLSLPRPRLAVQLAHSGSHHVLADGAAVHVSSALLSTLQPLRSGEIVRLQWLLSPVGPVSLPSVAPPRRANGRGGLATVLEWLLSGVSMDATRLAEWKRKHARPVFVATGRIGVTAAERGRARLLRGQVLAALHTANVPGGHLRRS
ncbi:MAG: hypothetical protein QG597_678, partial [Actinomycetota bacterium]|nr:hypothetical protein [Actinomycetota bacterium]